MVSAQTRLAWHIEALLLAAGGSWSGGCGADSGVSTEPSSTTSEESSSSPSTSSETEPATTASTTTDTTTSTTESATADSSSTGNPELCPAPHEGDFSGNLAVLVPDWPEDGPIVAPCEVLSFGPGPDRASDQLRLTCTHPSVPMPIDMDIFLSADAIDTHFDGLAGTSVVVSYYRPTPEKQVNGGPFYGTVTIRDDGGALILLASQFAWYDAQLAEGDEVEVARPGWLRPGTEAWEVWNDPFGTMMIRNVGCAPREALRPGSPTETPLALEFEADDGPVTVYDHTIEYGVRVDGAPFDVVVSDAFFRHELTCGDCAVTEAKLLLLRSAR